MNPLWLLLIIPLTASFSAIVMGCCASAAITNTVARKDAQIDALCARLLEG